MQQDIYAGDYTLSIFEGQGVKHPLGFGVVTRVEKPGTKVAVKFESGVEVVCESENLQPARMSESELEFLRAKHNLGSGEDEESGYDENEHKKEL